MEEYKLIDFGLVNLNTIFSKDAFACERYVKTLNSIIDPLVTKYEICALVMENQMCTNSFCVMLQCSLIQWCLCMKIPYHIRNP